jgi:peptidoglycan/LPS O-acetylase OafA/YrhL
VAENQELRFNRLGRFNNMTQALETTRAGDSRHYLIIDALRFVLAFWVLMGHFGLPPIFAGASESDSLVRNLVHGYSSIVFGLPAVMCFFVISGFCIHLPFRKGKRLPIGRFYARRYIRILIPVLAGVGIFRLSGNHHPLFGPTSVWWNSVLWSLLCEEIYYAIYPAMLPYLRKLGWVWLLVPSFACSTVFLVTHIYNRGWEDFGPLQTAAILYPVWILGCLLAEQSDSLAPITSDAEIWRWRFFVWACSWICEMLNFKARIYYPQTMVLFGVVAYFWLRKEIAFYIDRQTTNRITSLLAVGGAWSYSLYLMHVPVMNIFEKFTVPNFGPLINWCISTGFILVCSYIFYLAVERPSHQLARKLGAFEFKPTRIDEPRYPAEPLSPT